MSNLPVRLSEAGQTTRQVAKAVQAQERIELALFEAHLAARYLAEIDRIDSAAIADVTKTALEEELSVLDWGLEQASGNPAKAELVSRLVSMQSKIDSARIARRFGG